jgi:ankyrin repeat protein
MMSSLNDQLLDVAMDGGVAKLHKLILAGAEPNATNADGETPLIIASELGKARVVEALLVKGADVNKKSAAGMTALRWAVTRNHTEVIEILLLAGADKNEIFGDNWTPLAQAIETGNTEFAVQLIISGALRDQEPAFAQRMMRKAVANEVEKILEALIIASANLGFTFLDNLGIIQAAMRLGYQRSVRLLTLGSVDVTADKIFQVFLIAIENGETDLLAKMHTYGMDVNMTDSNGFTLLAHALALDVEEIEWQPQVVEALLKAGVEVNKPDKTGRTPLMMAAKYGSSHCLRELLSHGADLALLDNSGASAVEIARAHGYIEIEKILLAHRERISG